ncbi:hypothetical protein Pla175_20240 [Pirellulimonas nuda]|uniref:Uncharacterized protein n=1 Tax=Pirellulimonas nuda TaxID=2528009 RepID=A0A518DAY4_9BACT|nr:hypothetical protein [Pirellulimonas nuda]QDU88644.1 hypothetical protein Pla175_20240 [Pirellulimonas nuda]
MPLPPPPQDVLSREFLAARSLLLEAAAALDRVDRAGQLDQSEEASRLVKAAGLLADAKGPGRADRLQELFSLPYDPDWRSHFGV